MRLRVQVIDVHRKSRKTKVTSLVMKLFLGFLGASRTCAIIVHRTFYIGIWVFRLSLTTNTFSVKHYFNHFFGFSGFASFLISKYKAGVVSVPLLPTVAIVWFLFIQSPTSTLIDSLKPYKDI